MADGQYLWFFFSYIYKCVEENWLDFISPQKPHAHALIHAENVMQKKTNDRDEDEKIVHRRKKIRAKQVHQRITNKIKRSLNLVNTEQSAFFSFSTFASLFLLICVAAFQCYFMCSSFCFVQNWAERECMNALIQCGLAMDASLLTIILYSCLLQRMWVQLGMPRI